MTFLWCILALICGGFGVAFIVKPEEMIRWGSWMLYESCEPTEFHIHAERVKGVFMVIMAIVILISIFV